VTKVTRSRVKMLYKSWTSETRSITYHYRCNTRGEKTMIRQESGNLPWSHNRLYYSQIYVSTLCSKLSCSGYILRTLSPSLVYNELYLIIHMQKFNNTKINIKEKRKRMWPGTDPATLLIWQWGQKKKYLCFLLHVK